MKENNPVEKRCGITDQGLTQESEERWVLRRIRELTGQDYPGRPLVFSDTSNYMSIDRDNIIELEGELYLVRCSMKEGRFGLGEQPKFWVKKAMSLSDGGTYILKLSFYEEFKVHIGPLEIKCKRSEDKERRVLELVRGDLRFMQGRSALDTKGNMVRIIEFISGSPEAGRNGSRLPGACFASLVHRGASA